MQFKTLENTSIAALVHVFNEAFSDYAVPILLSKEQLINKFVSEGIKKENSVGVFEGDKPIAFILHGIEIINGKQIAYNAGTGVIPDKRGNRLTSKMYDFVLPELKKNNVDEIRLEVLVENKKAIEIYSSIGFEMKRLLNCYKGTLKENSSGNDITIKHIFQPDWKLLQSFWDWNPSWQNSASAIDNSWSQLDALGMYTNDELVGYVIYQPKINRIMQFAISKENRKNGFGKMLLQYFALNKSKTVSFMNVDDQSKEMNAFLTSAGLNTFIRQHEMTLSI